MPQNAQQKIGLVIVAEGLCYSNNIRENTGGGGEWENPGGYGTAS